ncbi:MAG TPA: alpha-2-macroglobulin [Synechococcus sp. M44_DOE_062]|nr:alpha-2-macroglobulin [Synechococcus sp. M44_DOE_062]
MLRRSRQRDVVLWLAALVLFLGVGLAVLLSEQPTGSLAGQVELPAGVVPEDVRVIVAGPVTRSASLALDGEYRLDRLPVGEYQVTVQGSGLETVGSEGSVLVQEGATVRIPTLRPQLVAPGLYLYSTSQVFTTAEPVRLQWRATSLGWVQFSLYRFSLTELQGSSLLQDLADAGYGSLDPALYPTLRRELVRSWQQPVPRRPGEGWAVQTVELGILPPGAYWVEAEGREPLVQTAAPLPRSVRVSGTESFHWFLVSDLGLIQKQDATQLVVQAVHLRELRPLSGIQIQVFGEWGDPLTATTDAEGLARFGLPAGEGSSVVVYGRSADNTLQALSRSYAYGWNQPHRIYAYTDRPLYRPGQTVYFRALVREQTRLTPPPAGQPVQLTLTAPNGDVLSEQTLATNAFGSVHGEFQLPEEAPLGSYGLEWQVSQPQGSSREYTSFQVEAYRKPEFAVAVVPDRPWLVRGGSLKVQVEAKYLFGAPVATAQLRYRVYSSPDWSLRYGLLPRSAEEDYFADDLGEEQGYYGGYGQLVAEGEGVTDAQGRAAFHLPRLLANLDWEEDSYWGPQEVQQLRIEVEVTDISRRTVTGSARAWVTAGEFALFAEVNRHLPAPGDTLTYRLQARDYDGRPVSATGELSLERWRWDPKSSTYQWQGTLLRQPFQIVNGEGSLTLSLLADLEPGDYRVRLTAWDPRRQSALHRWRERVQEVDYLWVVEPGSPLQSWGSLPSLEVVADRQIYQVGEEAQILIVSPLPDVPVLVGIEGSRLHQVQVLRLQGHTATLRLPIRGDYRPNLYVTATAIGPERRLYQNETLLRVSPLDRFLQVELQTDKPTYHPGETAQIQIRTCDAQGQPVSAEVSLGIVDNALYLLRPDSTPDIRRFFYGRQDNQVTTTTSFPQQYPGGADKLAGQVREDFRDTAAWFPDLVTDADGLAQVQVRWPDNLTTWRLTARAATADTQVGSALATVSVSKDLLVRLAAPRFFRVGDQLTLAAIVQNRTGQAQTVEVRLEVPVPAGGILKLQGPERQRLTVPAQGAGRVEWPLQVLGAGDTSLRVWAGGDGLQDALQLQIPSQPFGAAHRFSQVGQLGTPSGLREGDSSSLELPLDWPATWVPGSRQLHLELAASPAATLLGPLDYLVEFPYGCTEQTLSRFLPALAVAQVSEQLGLNLRCCYAYGTLTGTATPTRLQTLERLPRVLRSGLQRLEESQNYDGGWGWWAYDRSSPYLTGYVLQGYHLAQAAGYALKDWRVRQALDYLAAQLAQPQALSPDLRAFVAYSLSLWDPALVTTDLPPPAQLSTFGLAYRGLAALQLGQRNTAQADLDQALQRRQQDPQGRWFIPAASSKDSVPLTRTATQERSTYDDMEVAGPLLQLAVRLQDDRAAQIADALLQQRQNNRWRTTKATADALLGLSAYYQAQQQQLPGPGEVRVLDGKTGALLDRWQASAGDPRYELDWADAEVGNLSSLRLEKSGAGPLYYSLRGEAFVPNPLPSQAQGFAVSRSYFRLQPQPQLNGEIRYREQPLRPGDAVRAGEMLLARLTVEAERDSHYVVIEAPLPSGAEIASGTPSHWREQDPREFTAPDYWWDWFWTHQENRDDRVAFFSTELKRGRHEFVYLFRPEIPGQFQVAPALAEEMYDPSRYGRSAPYSLRVLP